MKMVEMFTYLSELFAGHPPSALNGGLEIPNKTPDNFDIENQADQELDEGGFLSQDLVTRRGGYDRHFLA